MKNINDYLIKTTYYGVTDLLRTELENALCPFIYTDMYSPLAFNDNMLYFDIGSIEDNIEEPQPLYVYRVKSLSFSLDLHDYFESVTFDCGGFVEENSNQENIYRSDIIDLIQFKRFKGFDTVLFKFKNETDVYKADVSIRDRFSVDTVILCKNYKLLTDFKIYRD